MGFYPSLQGLPYPYVCYVRLCVSHFSPRRGSRRPGFADVGPKVLVRYCNTPMAPNVGAGASPWGKTAKALPTRGKGWASVLRAYKTPIFAKGQKLTHSPAHVEKHAGQETPLLYTPYLQWHHPGGRALLQLAQAPTQDYHSYTHALLGGVDDGDKSPSGSPVRVQENTELLSFCGLTGTPQCVSLLGLGGKGCPCCVHSVNDEDVGLPLPLLAES